MQGLRLPPLFHDLAIDYTALSLVAPERVRFRFKLEGQDKDWREVGNQRRVEYSNLAPRNYRFLVTACNSDGVWNQEGTFFDFSVAPAYYQTNWFRTLCLVTLLGMLWSFYQVRVGVHKRRQELLEQRQRLLVERHELLERNQELLERHQAEVRALNERIIHVQEAERMRISGELHDGVLQ